VFKGDIATSWNNTFLQIMPNINRILLQGTMDMLMMWGE